MPTNWTFSGLVLMGEQGSAKSTTARFVKRLLDPCSAPLRTPPREERDLVIAANNSWVLAYDNVSSISNWLSDAFCRLATGGGYATRELYTNTDEVILDATRPVLLNGIDRLIERPDLADRALTLNLPRIDEAARREESRLNADLNEAFPEIFGALLDALSATLDRFPKTQLARLPRMADFARWATAATRALKFPEDAFANAYTGNRTDAVQEALEADLVAVAITALLEKREEAVWSGCSKDLLRDLETVIDEATKKQSEWPKSPRGLSGRLRRLTTFLREAGIEIAFNPRVGNQRPLSITKKK
jgi:hypothetical protein